MVDASIPLQARTFDMSRIMGAAEQVKSQRARRGMSEEKMDMAREEMDWAREDREQEDRTTKLKTLSNLMATVQNAPPERREDAYQQARQTAQRLGVPGESMPERYDPQWMETQINRARDIEDVLDDRRSGQGLGADQGRLLETIGRSARGLKNFPAERRGEVYRQTIAPMLGEMGVNTDNLNIDPDNLSDEVLDQYIAQTDEGTKGLAGEEGEAVADFGSGVRGRSMQIMSEMAPGYAGGELSDEEERTFMTAITDYRQPEQFTDPDTGLVRTRRREVPEFVREAFETRDVTMPGMEEGTEATPEVDPTADPAAEPTELPTVPEDARIPSIEAPQAGERTIMEEALAGNITGPIPILGRTAATIPMLGISAQEMTEAGTMLPLLRRRLVRALQTNPRFAMTEQTGIVEDLDIDPRFIDDAQAYTDRLVGVDRALGMIEAEAEAVTEGRMEPVSGETRQHAMDIRQMVHSFRDLMMPPRLNSEEEARTFIQSNPSGTKFTYRDEGGQWRVYEVE